MGINKVLSIVAIALVAILVMGSIPTAYSANVVGMAIEDYNTWINQVVFDGSYYYALVFDYNEDVFRLWKLDQSLNIVSDQILPYPIDDWIAIDVWGNYIVVYSELEMSVDVFDRSLNLVARFNISRILNAASLYLYSLYVLNDAVVLLVYGDIYGDYSDYVVVMDIYNTSRVFVSRLNVTLTASNVLYWYYGFKDYVNNRIIYPAYISNSSVFYPVVLEVYVLRRNSNLVVYVFNTVINIPLSRSTYNPNYIRILYDAHHGYYYVVAPRDYQHVDIFRYDPSTKSTKLSTVNISRSMTITSGSASYTSYAVFSGAYYLYDNIYILGSDGVIDIYDLNLVGSINITSVLGYSNIYPEYILYEISYYDRFILFGELHNITITVSGGTVNIIKRFVANIVVAVSVPLTTIVPLPIPTPTNTMTETTTAPTPTRFDWTMLLLLLMILLLIAGVAVATKR